MPVHEAAREGAPEPAGAPAREPARPLRRDARRSRDAILAAVAALLAEQGPAFTLTDAAREAGVATATAYCTSPRPTTRSPPTTRGSGPA
jgi:hypothetical protein